MASSTPAASIQDSGACGRVFEEACLCTVVEGHSEGDIKTIVTGLPVDPPKFISGIQSILSLSYLYLFEQEDYMYFFLNFL